MNLEDKTPIYDPKVVKAGLRKIKRKKFWFIFKFWFLSCTWGLPITIVSGIIILIAILCGGKPHKNGCSIIVEIGNNWGGLEYGPFALCGSYAQKNKECYSLSWYEHTRRHEFGHAASQFIYMGIFYLFIVGIPSAIRYWYDRLDKKNRSKRGNGWYDSIWFEGMATTKGTEYIKLLEGN